MGLWRLAGLGVVSLALTLAAIGAATAEDPASGATVPPSPDNPNWRVNCADESDHSKCTLLQNLVSQQGDKQQRLLTVLVQPGADGKPTLLLALPHGLFLPAGVQVQIDGGEPLKLVIQTADQNGAYAGTALTDALTASLRKGNELKVTVQSAQQQAIAVPVTLVGFSKAYDDYLAGKATPGAPTPK